MEYFAYKIARTENGVKICLRMYKLIFLNINVRYYQHNRKKGIYLEPKHVSLSVEFYLVGCLTEEKPSLYTTTCTKLIIHTVLSASTKKSTYKDKECPSESYTSYVDFLVST